MTFMQCNVGCYCIHNSINNSFERSFISYINCVTDVTHNVRTAMVRIPAVEIF